VLNGGELGLVRSQVPKCEGPGAPNFVVGEHQAIPP
jgi:hypothetical protein